MCQLSAVSVKLNTATRASTDGELFFFWLNGGLLQEVLSSQRHLMYQSIGCDVSRIIFMLLFKLIYLNIGCVKSKNQSFHVAPNPTSCHGFSQITLQFQKCMLNSWKLADCLYVCNLSWTYTIHSFKWCHSFCSVFTFRAETQLLKVFPSVFHFPWVFFLSEASWYLLYSFIHNFQPVCAHFWHHQPSQTKREKKTVFHKWSHLLA